MCLSFLFIFRYRKTFLSSGLKSIVLLTTCEFKLQTQKPVLIRHFLQILIMWNKKFNHQSIYMQKLINKLI